jgi:hypothetical protein
MTFTVVDGGAAAAGVYFVVRSLPFFKALLGIGAATNGPTVVTEVYLKEIADNTRDMRDGIVRLGANFDTHDQTMRDALTEMRTRAGRQP